MAREKKRSKMPDSAEVPISSMIDVIFLLIIFFVVTAAVDKEIEDEKVILTNAPHGKPVVKKDPRSVIINVRQDGTFTMGMHVVNMKQVEQTLKQSAAKYGVDIPIVIRADMDAQHGYVKKVMEAITNTQLYKVKFNAQQE